MKRNVLASLLLACLPLVGMAQNVDDLYYVPKKSSAKEVQSTQEVKQTVKSSVSRNGGKTVVVRDADGAVRNVDEYNRRYTSRDNEFSASGDTLYIDEKPYDERGEWVNGFNGTGDDYEYAMRIVKFRNPRYAIPVSSPLYWDVVYGGLYPSWDWNVYNDGFYAYVFPSYTNRLWWDWRFSSWGWGGYWGLGYYSWYSPWYYRSWYSPYWYDRYYYGYYGAWGYPYYYDRYYGYSGWGRSYRNYYNVSGRRGERYDSDGYYNRSSRGYSIGRTNGAPERNRRAGSRVVREVSDQYNVRGSGRVGESGYTRSTRSVNSESTYSRPSSTRSGSYSQSGSYQRMQNNGSSARDYRGSSSRSYSSGSGSFSSGSSSRSYSGGSTGGGSSRSGGGARRR